jgi:hypothetical protein
MPTCAPAPITTKTRNTSRMLNIDESRRLKPLIRGNLAASFGPPIGLEDLLYPDPNRRDEDVSIKRLTGWFLRASSFDHCDKARPSSDDTWPGHSSQGSAMLQSGVVPHHHTSGRTTSQGVDQSIGADRGGASRRWSLLPSNGLTDSTPAGCSNPSAISLPPRLKRATMPR